MKSPTAIAAGKLSDGTVALFITEQAGRIVTVRPDAPMPTDPALVLVIPEVVSDGETGLLGLALSPGWPADRRAFLNYTVAQGSTGLSTILARVEIPPSGPADPATLHEILRFEQPYRNHNSGSLAFGPDGLLYMGVGDGGSGGDPQGHAQNLGDWLGSILRIDVLGDVPYRVPEDNPFVHRSGALPEIWAYGVRNPWGMHFDRGGDHALWFADVGQDTWEEIDRGVPGANYGWNVREGGHPFRPTAAGTDPLVEPLAEYDHSVGISVTGGVVCRDPALPGLAGTYLYADFGTGVFFGYREGTSTNYGPSGLHPSTFADDDAGHVYVADYAGPVYRLTGAP